ncbi:MAG TPA: hypothetical protein VNZ64_04455 [Candidatus Acidoferrum sp.]|jgi:hypothetical protein|nr:hypothetical protein [Candidatus Acidoferrum sp.]
MALLSSQHSPGLPGWKLAATGGLVGALLAFGVSIRLAGAAQPQISLIEMYSTDQVLIHFDTEANRTYTLQYTTNLLAKTNALWFALYTTPNLPFFDHYVIPDTRNSPQRFYRLSATP